jgi:hypothetical protein
MVIWIVTLLDRYPFVHFLYVDDPPSRHVREYAKSGVGDDS